MMTRWQKNPAKCNLDQTDHVKIGNARTVVCLAIEEDLRTMTRETQVYIELDEAKKMLKQLVKAIKNIEENN